MQLGSGQWSQQIRSNTDKPKATGQHPDRESPPQRWEIIPSFVFQTVPRRTTAATIAGPGRTRKIGMAGDGVPRASPERECCTAQKMLPDPTSISHPQKRLNVPTGNADPQ